MNTYYRFQNVATMYIKWLSVTFTVLIVQIPVFALTAAPGYEPFFFLFTPVLSFIIGVVLGYFQSGLMKLETGRKYVWIVLVAVSMIVKNITIDFRYGFIFNGKDLIPAFIAGVVIGLAQFLILRKISKEAIWWLPTSALAWGLSALIGWSAYDYYYIGFYEYAVVYSAVIGLLTAASFVICFSKSKILIFGKIMLITFSLSLPVATWLSMIIPNIQQDVRFSVTNSVQQLQFSPDSEILAIAYTFNGIELRNVNNWEKVGQIDLKSEDTIESFAFSPDGQILAIGTSRGRDVVELWSLPSKEYIGELQGHIGSVNGVAFSPNGQWIASAGGQDDRRVILWDVSTREMLQVIHTLPPNWHDWFNDVAFSPDGNLLAAAIMQDGNGGVKIWDLGKNEVQHEFVDFPAPVYKLLFSPDGNRLAISSENIVKIFDTSTWDEYRTLNLCCGSITSFSFSPNSQVLAVGQFLSVELWDIEDGVRFENLRGHKDSSLAIAISPDGQWLASASRRADSETLILIWRLENYMP